MPGTEVLRNSLSGNTPEIVVELDEVMTLWDNNVEVEVTGAGGSPRTLVTSGKS